MINKKTDINDESIDYSIIIPTYNESGNIESLLDSIVKTIYNSKYQLEIIVVDDESPDGTGKIAELYSEKLSKHGVHRYCSLRVVYRRIKKGLISAIKDGISCCNGKYILVMDADFSHPPETILSMINVILENPCHNIIVVASRYMKGSSIVGWPLSRRIISKVALLMVKYGLGVKSSSDPLSGFFVASSNIIKDLNFETNGYKILIELLVKFRQRETKVIDVPFQFSNRRNGESKLGISAITHYILAVIKLTKFGAIISEW